MERNSLDGSAFGRLATWELQMILWTRNISFFIHLGLTNYATQNVDFLSENLPSSKNVLNHPDFARPGPIFRKKFRWIRSIKPIMFLKSFVTFYPVKQSDFEYVKRFLNYMQKVWKNSCQVKCHGKKNRFAQMLSSCNVVRSIIMRMWFNTAIIKIW